MKIAFENNKDMIIDERGLATREIFAGEISVGVHMGDDIKLWITIKQKKSLKNIFLGEFATGADVIDFLEGEEFQKIPFSEKISEEIKSYLAI